MIISQERSTQICPFTKCQKTCSHEHIRKNNNLKKEEEKMVHILVAAQKPVGKSLVTTGV